MEIKTKQRLVGILVLLAMLAIFLPLLFHTTRPSVVKRLSVAIPPRPAAPKVVLSNAKTLMAAVTAEKEQTELTPATERTAEKTQPVNSAASTVQANAPTAQTSAPAMQAKTPRAQTNAPAASATVPTAQAKAPSAQTNAPAANNVKATEQAVPEKQIQPTKNATERPTKPSVPAKKKQPAGPTSQNQTKPNERLAVAREPLTLKPMLRSPKAWVVQLGAFANKDNADRLITKLRSKGFDAYTRPITEAQGQRLYRVYVGPEIRLDAVQKLRAKLQASYHLRGVVRKYKT